MRNLLIIAAIIYTLIHFCVKGSVELQAFLDKNLSTVQAAEAASQPAATELSASVQTFRGYAGLIKQQCDELNGNK